jgi:hypothetical protein
LIERVVEIPYQKGDSLYGQLFSMGQTLQDYSERIGDGDLVSIIDGSVDQFMEDIRSSRGGWESMKDWIEENWPEGWSDDLGSRSESLPLHIAYGAAGFGPNAEDIGYFEMEELNPFLTRVFGQLEDMVEPQEISLRSKGWRWKRGVDYWSEHLKVPISLFQIDPDSLKGWEIVLHGTAYDFIINRRFK